MAAAPVPAEDELEPPSDPQAVARSICLRALTDRARSRNELSALLRRRGIPDNAASFVLDRFVEVGLIDDGALANTYALAAHHDRGLARRAVAVKLRQRGIDEPDVQAALGQIDEDSELAAARSLAQRKLRTLGGLEPPAQVRRLVGLLCRRGYSPGLAYGVVKQVLDAVELPDNDELSG